MIRKPEELAEPIRKAVDHRAVVLSHVLLAVVVAAHTALSTNSLMYQKVLAVILSSTLIILILLRTFDLGTVNKRPLIYIIFYQIFVFLGFAFISDPATPYLAGVYLVVFASNMYYGAKGVWITVACLGVTSITKYFYLSSTTHITTNDKLNIIVSFVVFAGICSMYVNYQKVFDWDRARLKETEAKLESSINSLELGFIITNDQPEITMANSAAHQLLCGSTEHSATSCSVMKLDTLLRGFDNPLLGEAIKKTLTTMEPASLRNIDFKDRTWSIFVSPMIDRLAITGAAIIIQDITQETLLSRSRDEFFSIASHELRTPLTTIRGNASMMTEYYPDAFKDPALRQMVTDIHGSSEHLIAIVNDFLDVSRLEQGQVTYKMESVEAKEVVDKVLEELKHEALKKKVKIHTKVHAKLPELLADKARAAQIIYNLVDNAIKFAPGGTVTVDALEGPHKTLKITVADTGHGVEEKLQPLLFRKFQQAGESLLTRQGEGTGLGLYVSKLIAKGMGGSLDLESSEVGKGSVFSFTLPQATPERLAKTQQHPAALTDTKSGLSVHAEE